MINNCGEVFSFGANDCGLLAVGDDNRYSKQQRETLKIYKPHKIDNRWFGYSGVNKIKCGVCHVCVLNDRYDVYVWGQMLSCGVGKKVGIQTPHFILLTPEYPNQRLSIL